MKNKKAKKSTEETIALKKTKAAEMKDSLKEQNARL
jgi:hypothetical protein